MNSELVDTLWCTGLFQMKWTRADDALNLAETTADRPTILWLPNPMPLRALVASITAFIGHGYLRVLWPVLILHATMPPSNIHRPLQEMSLNRAGDVVRCRPQKHAEPVGRFPAFASAVSITATSDKTTASDAKRSVVRRCIFEANRTRPMPRPAVAEPHRAGLGRA